MVMCASSNGPAPSCWSSGQRPLRRGNLIKIHWHDGLGMSLYAKRLEHGRFIWLSPADGVIAITAAQLGYMLEGIDCRNPLHSWRPHAVG